MQKTIKVFPGPADEVIKRTKTMTDKERNEAQKKASERAARIREYREQVIARRAK